MSLTTPRRRAFKVAAGAHGSVSAEAAVALPALVVILAAGLWGVGIGSLQARCTNAARSAALAGARGEADSAIAGRVTTALGAGSGLTLSRSGASVSARVTASQDGVGLLPTWIVSAVATAELEPGGPMLGGQAP